ncbi:MAG TPA: hypothetical protein DIT10_23735 [Chryseobacterium sp.]|nr:hypothetical protein [Chryseobacterium sp.]
MWTHSARFDKKEGKIILNNDYAFSFSTYEGFSYKLLYTELLIDNDFNYILQMSVFEHENKTKDFPKMFQEKGKLPEKIFDYLEILLDADLKSLKRRYSYSNFDISDIGSQRFLINLYDGIEISIDDGLPLDYYFTTDVEVFLYDFNEYLKNWMEEKYQTWIL